MENKQHGDVALFEKLSLEGAQSGLSWLTILRKRNAYRKTFHNFDIDAVASMTSEDVDRILAQEVPKAKPNEKDPRRSVIVRHRGKIEAVIQNAKCIQQLYQDPPEQSDDTTGDTQSRTKKGNPISSKKDSHEVFDQFLWSFVQHKPILNTDWDGTSLNDAPSKTPESEEMSKALKKLGFRFVGPTTCYAMMQSVGMVIDHPVGSPEWKAAKQRLEGRQDGYQTK